MILLSCAVEKELAFWKSRPDVDVLVTGVGPVEAALSIAHAIAQRRYRIVVNAGLAGSFEGAAVIGEGVVVSDDALELALENGKPILLPDNTRVVDKAFSDPHLVAALRAKGFSTLHGITVARVTATEETADRLALMGAQVESMEGFAALRAAGQCGVPAIELRGISNRVGSRERSGWNFEAGANGLQHVLNAFFAHLDASRTVAP